MLIKEELQNIKLPLSDDDYVMISKHYPAHLLAFVGPSADLYEAYKNKMCSIFDEVFPGNQYPEEDKTWYPPQTEKYRNHLVNVWLRDHREKMKQAKERLFNCTFGEERYEFEESLADGLVEYGIQPNPPEWLEWPEDKDWPPYWLVKARLKEVKLPLSDEDYVKIHNYIVLAHLELKLISEELEEAYDLKMWTIFYQLFPEDNLDRKNFPWFPPQTEAYKDHPINVRLRERREQLVLTIDPFHCGNHIFYII